MYHHTWDGMKGAAQLAQQTWIGPESDAYNTYSGAHTGSNRRGKVRFPDGKLRIVTLGVPDTYFTIPAHGRINGKYVSGFVSMADDGEYEFSPMGREDE